MIFTTKTLKLISSADTYALAYHTRTNDQRTHTHRHTHTIEQYQLRATDDTIDPNNNLLQVVANRKYVHLLNVALHIDELRLRRKTLGRRGT